MTWLEPDAPTILRMASVPGTEYLQRGEALRLSGDTAGALELYRKAEAEFPARNYPGRFQCLLLAELGRKAEARSACERATAAHNDASVRRAMVAALMAGSGPLPALDLARAEVTSRALVEQSASRPWGYAAKADIALRIGDDEMLYASLADLRRVAPDHFETKRVERIAASRHRLWAVAAGWAVLVAACVATLVHALRRSARQMRASTQSAAAAAVLVLLTCTALTARANEPAQPSDRNPELWYGLSKHGINEKDPESSVPTAEQRDRNPVEYGYHLMDLTDKAELAAKAGDPLLAARYYRALAKAVPERAISYAKMCEMYERAGDREQALAACSVALSREGVRVEHYSLYGRVMLSKRGELTTQEVQDLAAVIDHLRTQKEADFLVIPLQCDLGVRTAEIPRLEECVAGMSKSEPNSPKTLSYQWTLALHKKNFGEAERLIERAKHLGVPAGVIQKMELATATAIPFWRKPQYAVPIVLAALGALGGLVILLRRRRRESPPSPQPAEAQLGAT